MLSSIVKTLQAYCSDLFRDIDGKFSSKRLVTLGGSGALFIGYFCNLFAHLHIDDNVVEAMKWLTGGGLASVASEKFAPKAKEV